MGYIVESFREDDKVLKRLHEAKMALCAAIDALDDEEYLMMERKDYKEMKRDRNYRGSMHYRDYRDRYDY